MTDERAFDATDARAGTADETRPHAAGLAQTDKVTAADVGTSQLGALVATLRELDEADWDRPTDCDRWRVRELVAHVVGALDEGAHLRVFLRHGLMGRRRHPRLEMLDGINEAQIDDRRDWASTRLLQELAVLAPRAVRARRRMPAPVRRLRLPAASTLPPGSTMAYLADVITSRDVWMHRIDIARATGRELTAAPGDEEVVRQVVRDLGRAWSGPPVALELTGLVTGRWLLGSGVPAADVRVDAVEYCRLLSGRAADPEVMVDGDLAIDAAIRSARVAF